VTGGKCPLMEELGHGVRAEVSSIAWNDFLSWSLKETFGSPVCLITVHWNILSVLTNLGVPFANPFLPVTLKPVTPGV
jgi:hypothetical protein